MDEMVLYLNIVDVTGNTFPLQFYMQFQNLPPTILQLFDLFHPASQNFHQ